MRRRSHMQHNEFHRPIGKSHLPFDIQAASDGRPRHWVSVIEYCFNCCAHCMVTLVNISRHVHVFIITALEEDLQAIFQSSGSRPASSSLTPRQVKHPRDRMKHATLKVSSLRHSPGSRRTARAEVAGRPLLPALLHLVELPAFAARSTTPRLSTSLPVSAFCAFSAARS